MQELIYNHSILKYHRKIECISLSVNISDTGFALESQMFLMFPNTANKSTSYFSCLFDIVI